MAYQTREQVAEEKQRRRDRVYAYMTQDPPVPLARIAQMEGMHERPCRRLVKDIDKQYNLGYTKVAARTPNTTSIIPYGLTASTNKLRQRLGDHLYFLRERGNGGDTFGRSQVGPRVGLNRNQQRKAEERPYSHDWTLSQIERLAREIGDDPMEFLLKCMTT